MSFDANTLWENFKQSFKMTVKSYPIPTLEQSWVSKAERSKFYFESLLPKISELLELEFRTERPFRIDAIFFKRGSQTTDIPVIYIESENNIKSSNEEIYKLCCISAPLKILFVCNSWTEKQKDEIVNGYWQYIIEDFAEAKLLSGNICILIAEWDDNLKFYSYCFNSSGFLFEEEVLISI